MKFHCSLGKIRYILAHADRFLMRRIEEEKLPILVSHVPLFYILPEDKSLMIFNEVVTKARISKSSVSDIITKYQSLNIVIKHECREDKRSVYVGLTDEGVRIRKMLMQFELEFRQVMLADVSESDRALLDAILDVAVCNMPKCEKC